MRATQKSRWAFTSLDLRFRLYHQLISLALLLLLGLVLIQSISLGRITNFPSRPANPVPFWVEKPVLGYFVFTPSLASRLSREAGLSEAQFQAIEQITHQELEVLRAIEQESLPIIQDSELSLQEKRSLIVKMRYNERVRGVVRASRDKLKNTLGIFAYARLSQWIQRQWQNEREIHGSVETASGPRTYRIFATRYDAGGAYTVALPDKCLKFANGGNHICDSDGYVAGAGYTVFLSYEGSTAAIVGESGPWNVDDNYWATTSDPTPRRMFADLALGMPEAQAAYFNGYNGGVDQFGRVVTAPFGIDLARQVSIDIGLQPGNNDWIDVSFLWTEGWDGSADSQPPQSDATAIPQPTKETIIPIEVASPNPDGSVVHVVQEGQTLWNIASAYQVSLQEILVLNGLSDGALIYPGQKLLIKLASQTPTLTSTSTPETEIPSSVSTATLRPTRTVVPRSATAIAQIVSTPLPPQNTPNAVPTAGVSSSDPDAEANVDPFIIGIVALAGVGLFLLILGQWLNRRS